MALKLRSGIVALAFTAGPKNRALPGLATSVSQQQQQATDSHAKLAAVTAARAEVSRLIRETDVVEQLAADARAKLGAACKQLRVVCGLSPRLVATRIGWGEAKAGRVELTCAPAEARRYRQAIH